MNGTTLKFDGLVPENKKKYAVDEITICCDCGSVETTILTFGIYCRSCRSFRYFKNKVSEKYRFYWYYIGFRLK